MSTSSPAQVAAVWLTVVAAALLFWTAIVFLVGWEPIALVAIGVLTATVTAHIHYAVRKQAKEGNN